MTNSTKIATIKMLIALLYTVVFFSTTLVGQNAESLFETHHKWGVTGQFNTFSAADISTTNNLNLNFKILKTKRLGVGLTYNAHQTKHWNFKAALQLQWFSNQETLFISKAETALLFDIDELSGGLDELLVYLPLTVEYVVFANGKFSFSLGVGIGFTHYKPIDRVTTGLSIDGVDIFNANYINRERPIYTSDHLEASVYFKTKHILLQASVIYKNSFEVFRSGDYSFTNLQQSPDVSGAINQSGDFLGFSLTLYFKKGEKHKK